MITNQRLSRKSLGTHANCYDSGYVEFFHILALPRHAIPNPTVPYHASPDPTKPYHIIKYIRTQMTAAQLSLFNLYLLV